MKEDEELLRQFYYLTDTNNLYLQIKPKLLDESFGLPEAIEEIKEFNQKHNRSLMVCDLLGAALDTAKKSEKGYKDGYLEKVARLILQESNLYLLRKNLSEKERQVFKKNRENALITLKLVEKYVE